MGHLIPLAEFAKRLVHHHNFSVTFLVPTDGPPSAAVKAVLSALLPSHIDHVFLPPVSFRDLSGADDVRMETLISLTVTRSLPAIRAALKSLAAATRLAALVVDLFGTDAFDAATELNVPNYIFYPSTAMALSLFLHLPQLHDSVCCEFRDLPGPVCAPGCIPIHGSVLLDPLQDRKNDAYSWVLHHATRYRLADGIMVNSFTGLEPGPLKALQQVDVPVYPVGPLVKMDSGDIAGSDPCLRWLDNQPPGSVLFISFGSGGTLSSDQLSELALGLELSEQRFLWVARSPNDGAANATYFSAESQADPFGFLPQGFLARTRSRGLVVSSWAPQPEVLAHGATGGFLSHCGWNSALESVVRGVALIAWPLYAEQKMNAAMLVEDLRVALRPTPAVDGVVVGRREIARVTRELIEGEEGKRVRSRMRDLKDAAAAVLSENGSSAMSLAELAHKWKATTHC